MTITLAHQPELGVTVDVEAATIDEAGTGGVKVILRKPGSEVMILLNQDEALALGERLQWCRRSAAAF